MSTNAKTCEHCGAVGADLFANDGSAVCERCFAYDQVVAGELRVSQADLGMVASGDAADLQKSTRKVGRQELILTLVLLAAGAAFFAYGTIYPIGYFGGAIVTVMALLIGAQAYRTMRFAKTQAPAIMRRASSAPPPAMTGPAARKQA